MFPKFVCANKSSVQGKTSSPKAEKWNPAEVFGQPPSSYRVIRKREQRRLFDSIDDPAYHLHVYITDDNCVFHRQTKIAGRAWDPQEAGPQEQQSFQYFPETRHFCPSLVLCYPPEPFFVWNKILVLRAVDQQPLFLLLERFSGNYHELEIGLHNFSSKFSDRVRLITVQ